MLEKALQSWVIHSEIDEIVIVDWSSDKSLIPLIKKFQDGRIFLAVVENQKNWILSVACNLAARLTTRSFVLKMDADVVIHRGFFDNHKLQSGLFYTGNWALGRDENQTHLNGVAFLFRNDFFKVNGYNEYIKSYGWEDSDLYLRLEKNDLKRYDFNHDYLYHIEHGSRTLYQNKPGYFKNISDSEREHLNIVINRHFGYNTKPWSLMNKMVDFSVTGGENNLIYCKQAGKDHNITPVELIHKSEASALQERIQTSSPELSQPLLDQFERLELIEFYNLIFGVNKNTSENYIFSIIKKTIQHYSGLKQNDEAEINRLLSENKISDDKIGALTIDLYHKDQKINSLEQSLNEDELTIKDRDRTISERDKAIRDRDAGMHQLEKVISDKTEQVIYFEKSLNDKNNLIARLQEATEQLNSDLAKQNQHISDLDSIILEQVKLVHHYEVSASTQINEIKTKDEEIFSKAAIINNQEAVINSKNIEIQKLEQTINYLTIQKAQHQYKIEEIYHSYSWRFGHAIFSLIGTLVPGLRKTGKGQL